MIGRRRGEGTEIVFGQVVHNVHRANVIISDIHSFIGLPKSDFFWQTVQNATCILQTSTYCLYRKSNMKTEGDAVKYWTEISCTGQNRHWTFLLGNKQHCFYDQDRIRLHTILKCQHGTYQLIRSKRIQCENRRKCCELLKRDKLQRAEQALQFFAQ